MVKKELLETLVRTLLPLLKDALGLDEMTVNVTVGHSRSKLFKSIGHEGDWAAICCPKNGDEYDIFIAYNKQKDTADAIGSIVHELLHVKMRDVSCLVKTKYVDVYNLLEEEIVAGIERLIVSFIK